MMALMFVVIKACLLECLEVHRGDLCNSVPNCSKDRKYPYTAQTHNVKKRYATQH